MADGQPIAKTPVEHGPWEDYQQQAPVEHGPWEDYGPPPEQNAAPTAPPDTRNSFQQRIDNAINTPSATGPRWLDSFGRGAAQSMLTPAAHPWESAKGLVHALEPDPGVKGAVEGIVGGPGGPLMAHTLEGLYDDYKQNGLMHAFGNAAGGFMAGEATGGALRGIGNAARATGSGIDNFMLGTKAGDIERGANPGAGLSENHIWGSNPNALLQGVNKVLPKVSKLHNEDIARFTNPGTIINTGPLVSSPFNAAVDEATDPITGAAMPAQIAKTLKTQRTLTHELDPNSGQLTYALRNPNMTPLQANKLKSNIYGMTDYDNPSRAAISNAALKKSAHNLKVAIEQAAPGAKASGQRLHNLMSAKDTLIPQAQGTRLMPASKAGIIERIGTGAGTGGAALLDAAGNGLSGDVGRYIHAPILAPALVSSGANPKLRR